MTKIPRITLASASPRRRELLARLNIPFSICPVEIDERPLPKESPSETAKRVALRKAKAASGLCTGIILGADTIVAVDGTVLGKPRDEGEACQMLRLLRGRQHTVTTGIAVLNTDTNRTYIAAVATRVWMRDYSEEELAAYVKSGDAYDKAGGYAIQNPLFHPVSRIEGCYFNVVGLPLCEVARGLATVGYPADKLPLVDLPNVCPHNRILQM